MSSLGILLYGAVVTAIVATACYLVVRGIIEDRRDRAELDAGPWARMPSGGPVHTDAAARTAEVPAQIPLPGPIPAPLAVATRKSAEG